MDSNIQDIIKRAQKLLDDADTLTTQAIALLDPIACAAIETKSATEIRKVADLMPSVFHRTEMRLLAGQLERGELSPSAVSTVGFR